MIKNIFKYLLLILFLSIPLYLSYQLGRNYFEIKSARGLEEKGKITQGTIESSSQQEGLVKNFEIEYSFVLNGNTLKSKQSTSREHIYSLPKGSKIDIFYDENNPKNNVPKFFLTETLSVSLKELLALCIGFSIITFAIVVVFVYMEQYRKEDFHLNKNFNLQNLLWERIIKNLFSGEKK